MVILSSRKEEQYDREKDPELPSDGQPYADNYPLEPLFAIRTRGVSKTQLRCQDLTLMIPNRPYAARSLCWLPCLRSRSLKLFNIMRSSAESLRSHKNTP